jgi:hypothetical protein
MQLCAQQFAKHSSALWPLGPMQMISGVNHSRPRLLLHHSDGALVHACSRRLLLLHDWARLGSVQKFEPFAELTNAKLIPQNVLRH